MEEENKEKEMKKSSQENSSQMTKEAVQKIAQKGAKKFAGKASLMGPLAHIVAVAAPILVIIIILGGIILFFLTMPGMVMEQLKAIFSDIAQGICSWFGSDDTKQVSDEDICSSLDYLEEMGYDVKGYGFLTDYMTEDDLSKETEKENKKSESSRRTLSLDEDIGVIRADDNIIQADSDFLYAYLVSDNYVYTVANKNLVTQTGEGFWSKVWGGIKATAVHFYDFFGGETPNDWTRGLINIWEEDEIGSRGKFFSDTGFLNFDNIEIDPKGKTLTLKSSSLFNMNGSMKYSLDGWTGRYGMPLEFLLSVHVATMMPDLAYDMANTFNTKINILLHKIEGADVTASFKEGNSYITYDQINSKCGGWGFDGCFTTAKEAMQVMKEYHISSPSNCTGYDSDGVGTESVDNATKANNKKDDKAIESYNEILAKMKEYGYSDDESIPMSPSGGADFDSYLNDITDKKNENYDPDAVNPSVPSVYNKYEYYYEMDQPVSWTGEYNGEACIYTVTMKITHYKQISKYKANTSFYGQGISVTTYTREDCDEESLSITCSEITRGWTDSEWEEAVKGAKEELSKTKTEEEIAALSNQDLLGLTKCSDAPDGVTECCETCRLYIKKIYDTLKSPDDGDFDYYIPYIENVINHWYRDVYFTSVHYDSNNQTDGSNIDFVDYDYDYEAVMKERWTKYITDDDTGEYKLYALGKDGDYATNTNQIENYKEELFEKDDKYYVFKGSQEEAMKQEIAVSKKAETLSTSDTDILKDLGWNNDADKDIWNAYKRDGKTATNWEQTYPDEDTSTLDGLVKSKIYTKMSSDENIVQVGEGLRAETNNKIKKMFLQNKYLKYDGTRERAEEITKIRKDKNIEYGALTTTDESVLQYAARVALNQDSLNAFSMLENTHTLDADYIYRDFKELIVELGYFTKEELTDETPRLLQWLVPDIGSGGYPERSIDKNENEFGTMVHSKGDIDANRKNTLQSIISAAIEDASKEESSDDEKENKVKSLGTENNKVGNENSKLDLIFTELDGEFSRDQFVSLGTITQSPSGGETKVKSGGSGSSSLLSLDEWWEETQKIFDIYKSEGWLYDGHGPNGEGSSHGCNASTTFDEVHDSGGEKTTDCSIGASWMLQKLGALQDNHTFTSALGDSGSLADTNQCAKDLLEAGAEVIAPAAGTQFSAAALDGELQPGDVLFYDGHVSIYCGDSYETGGTTFCWDTGSTSGIQGGGPRDTSWEDRDIKLIIRLPLGNKKSEGSPYEGYMGNEAVVSPVTGILLDYGTYDDDDKSSITGEKYRQNVDLKYAKSSGDDKDNPDNNGGNNNESKLSPEYDPEKPDKVGYAKILVLDAEHYKKLESQAENPWQSDSLVNMKSKTDEDGNKVSTINYKDSITGEWILDKEDRLSDKDGNESTEDPWTEIAKTVYGYKEFAERYEMAGISGYIVYIDGFKCEKPDEDFTEEQLESEIPQGDKIELKDFQKVKPSDLQGTEKPEEDDMMPTLYEKDETHKMASQKATEKAQAEAEVKNQASSTLYLESEDLIFIKEGTLLGRTITDYELIEGSDYRNEQGGYDKYRGKKEATENPDDSKDADKDKADKKDEEEENTDAVIGNYLRIILRDTDDTVVENVEDYMKLDDGTNKKRQECEFEHLAYFLGCLEESFSASMDQGNSYGVEVLKDNAGNTTAFGLTKAVTETVKGSYPDFGSHLAAGSVPKEEAQDVFILVLEAAKESIQKQLTTPLEENDSNLFALIDLHHASPAECQEVIKEYNAKGNNFSSDELMQLYLEHWGSNQNYRIPLRRRGRNRGWLASEGRWFLYQKGSEGDEVIFDSDTPWTEFCDNGGTTEWTQESCGLYHVEKGADPDYIKD